MKKIIIFSTATILSANLTAQDLAPKVDSKSEVCEKKNEIGVNTTPLFKVLLGTTQSEINRYALTYKRALNDKSALRFSAVFDYVNMNGYNQSNYMDTLFQEIDNSVKAKRRNYSDYLKPHINIGYERQFGKKKFRWFYGADLIFGYYKAEYSQENISLLSDTTASYIHWIDNNGQKETEVSKKTTAFFTGMNAFFGAKYPVSKRFSVSAQVGFDMTYEKQTTLEKNNYYNTQHTYQTSSFDFSFGAGIISDVSLIYKF